MNFSERTDELNDYPEATRYLVYKLFNVVTDLEADRLLQLAEAGKKKLFKDCLRIMIHKYSKQLRGVDKVGLGQVYN